VPYSGICKIQQIDSSGEMEEISSKPNPNANKLSLKVKKGVKERTPCDPF
jgi:hypothetical protein